MTTRGDFLATGTMLAALSATGPTVAKPKSSPAPSPEPSFPALNFDLAGFDALLTATAPHKHLFASTKLNGGLVLDQIHTVGKEYPSIGVPLTDYRPVAVFYHGLSVMLGFDDAIWNQYFIPLQPKLVSLNDASKDFSTVYTGKTRGNPCLHRTGGKDDTSMENLVGLYGAHFFVCNEAAKGFSQYFIARHLKLDPVAVYQKLAAHLVPNAMLVPAGVWAVHAIQERRYTYLQATL